MRAVMAGLATMAVVVLAGGAVVGQDGAKIDGKLLVGKWTPDEDGKKGKMFIEMTKDGKLVISVSFGDKELKIDGTYKLDGNKLLTKMSFMGEEKSETMVVNKLTEKELVTTDEKGKKDTLVRVPAKKGK